MSTQDLLAIHACCAICQAPPEADCTHESERLERALHEAQERWRGVYDIRKWVLDRARLEVARIFHDLKLDRLNAHHAYLQKLPCYTIYAQYQGNPPIEPARLHALKVQIHQAESIFRQGINEDWQQSCMRYPVVLDYFFSLVKIKWPHDGDPLLVDPRYGGPKRVRQRRESFDHGRYR